MKLLRTIVFALGILMVVGGYAASQFFWWTGRAENWHRAIDRPEIAMLASVVLIGCFLSSFIPDDKESQTESA